DLGRFISPDPFVPYPGDPQNFNRYSYVENNPVNKIDPSGYKSFWKKVGKFFKTLFSKPGRLFASIAVGVFTGFVLGPAGLGLLSSSWAIGAVAGAAAGATSAGLNGGNPLLGALIGGTLGFIG
ncbi:MAG TPA: integrin, partial [Planctomycetia bacterium]|nr:integrin [Planctomycetia bacterium]